MELNREELAWAAGFFDGEGHIGLVKTGNNRHIHIQICQTAEGPLERFLQAVGVGKIYGPYTSKIQTSNKRPYKQLHIDTFEHVQHVVCLLWSWLSMPKRKQALKVLSGYTEYLARPYIRPGPKTDKGKGNATCHPDKPYASLGFCESCYRKQLRARHNAQA